MLVQFGHRRLSVAAKTVNAPHKVDQRPFYFFAYRIFQLNMGASLRIRLKANSVKGMAHRSAV